MLVFRGVRSSMVSFLLDREALSKKMNPEEIFFIQNTKKGSQIYKAHLFEWEETSLQVLSQIKEFEHNDGNDGIPELTWAVLNVKARTEASQGKTKTNEN